MDETLIKLKWNKIDSRKSVSTTGDVNKDIVDFLLEKYRELEEQGKRVIVLAYKHHEVVMGEIKNGEIILNNPKEMKPEYLKAVRMFSQKGELYTWKQGEKFKYRMRIDKNEKEKEPNVYEEAHLVWGQEVKDGYIIFEKDRGMEILLPFKVNKKQLPLRYKVRNYFQYDDNGQIQFIDARLVEIFDNKGEEI